MASLVRPVIFNILTIAALLFALAQLVILAPGRTTPTTTEAVQLLAELARESDAVDETLGARMAADQARRQLFSNNMIATIAIAILANVIANYLGRGRQRTNRDRIRRLEAELQELQSRGPQSEG
ncbi:MAG: hypothetical protein F4X14_20115 [Caldilineaceae bacterium SB0661_bin_32]|uniref:Uncharacterized protein n=1 Tax=Caldilineaceae bacterium SB0661_bin_32 TaxID=2605255 RepID=A0A6B1DCF1_9CHLR|nr:hypothetical protein [Caldilineaceae bacterium SB0661_bin_32]